MPLASSGLGEAPTCTTKGEAPCAGWRAGLIAAVGVGCGSSLAARVAAEVSGCGLVGGDW